MSETIHQRQLREIRKILADTYSLSGINIWLHARNRNLHMRRPADMLAGGQGDVVLEEAKRVAGS